MEEIEVFIGLPETLKVVSAEPQNASGNRVQYSK